MKNPIYAYDPTHCASNILSSVEEIFSLKTVTEKSGLIKQYKTNQTSQIFIISHDPKGDVDGLNLAKELRSINNTHIILIIYKDLTYQALSSSIECIKIDGIYPTDETLFSREDLITFIRITQHRMSLPISRILEDSPHTILIVDDDVMALKQISCEVEYLYPESIVLTAESVSAASELLIENRIDISLIDQQMPERFGRDLFAILSRVTPETMSVLITAFSNLEDTIETINFGNLCAFISKPIKIEKLQAVIDESIRRHASRKEAHWIDGVAKELTLNNTQESVELYKTLFRKYEAEGAKYTREMIDHINCAFPNITNKECTNETRELLINKTKNTCAQLHIPLTIHETKNHLEVILKNSNNALAIMHPSITLKINQGRENHHNLLAIIFAANHTGKVSINMDLKSNELQGVTLHLEKVS